MEPHMSPAPWFTSTECGGESVVDSDGFMVADCAIFSLSRRRRGCSATNARVIAALPSLLRYVQGRADAGCATASAILSAQGMETRQGGDGTAPSRSDDSPVAESDAP